MSNGHEMARADVAILCSCGSTYKACKYDRITCQRRGITIFVTSECIAKPIKTIMPKKGKRHGHQH